MRYSCCLHFFLFYLGWNSRMKCVHGGSIVNRTYIETISDSNLDPNGFGANRTGKFLFDSIFRIGSDINTVFDYDDTDDDVDYDAATNVRTCNCDCGQSNQEIRIVGGKPTGVNQFPWMVRLVYDGKFHCGGTLLTKDYVMTAAHCVKRLRRSKIRIILGDHDQYITTETRAIQRAVTSIIKHRRFDPDTYNNDIALLRLRKPVVFSKTIRPICLPRMNYDPADCGQSNQEIRIVGGKPTGVNQFPWMVRLVYDGKFHCGGTLLTKDYVMTAAHCVKRLRRSKIRIILGDHDQYITTETRAIQRAVTSIIKHRRFDPDTYNNDIALLRLRKPVVFSKTIRPICLPRMNYDPAGRIGTVVGWGRTSEGGELPGIVNHVKVPILTINDCRNQKYKSSRITASMLCAGKPSQDSCQGDSGGPLLLSSGYKYHIVGIVSWGVGCGREGYPGVYTRVSKFVPWIKANLEGTCLCT